MTGVPVARFHGCREVPLHVRNQLPPAGGHELLLDLGKVIEVAVRVCEPGRQLIKAQEEVTRCPLIFHFVLLVMLQTVPSLPQRASGGPACCAVPASTGLAVILAALAAAAVPVRRRAQR
ncbi:hypothetical protein [Streptomyces sp. NPDC058613]|uniref:hypothetical protein n=1 Tax=unclassified Streptomyces TaxID=2593676 RepID=UPI003652A669